MIPRPARVMALDWGELRIGLALSDETQLLASPLETLTRRAGKRFPMPRFLELSRDHQTRRPGRGPPARLGRPGERVTAAARELAALVGARTGLPVELPGRTDDQRAGAGGHPRAWAGRRAGGGRTWTPWRRW